MLFERMTWCNENRKYSTRDRNVSNKCVEHVVNARIIKRQDQGSLGVVNVDWDTSRCTLLVQNNPGLMTCLISLLDYPPSPSGADNDSVPLSAIVSVSANHASPFKACLLEVRICHPRVNCCWWLYIPSVVKLILGMLSLSQDNSLRTCIWIRAKSTKTQL